MKTLLKNGNVINVFTGEIQKADLLFEDKIIGIGDYSAAHADYVYDISGKYVCPGLIDGHIHIESTMLLPYFLSKVCLQHGTTTIIADPHEIANVCGKAGIDFILQSSEGLPFDIYLMLPSCVPATKFDESGAVLDAEDLEEFYNHPRVLGLAEMMNYVGVCNNDSRVLDKINRAKQHGKIINGHAPLLKGEDLDKYIYAGIRDDHECSNMDEALEKLRKGQKIMIREGSTAKNLTALLTLFDDKYANRCMLVSDDKHPSDLIENGHLDNSIRTAVKYGKSVLNAIKMATLIPAEHFGLTDVGAIAPGYTADILILDNLDEFVISDVYKRGVKIVENGVTKEYNAPKPNEDLLKQIKKFNLSPLSASDFIISPKSNNTRIIKLIKNELITDQCLKNLDYSTNNGICADDDIVKIAVIERHKNTSHKAVGFVQGLGLKKGAIASTVAHDSHNLIVIGANEHDMAAACNRIIEMGGGCVSVLGGTVIGEMPLPIGGLMSELSAQQAADKHKLLSSSVRKLGIPDDVSPFMAMAFLSLPVIPHIKITTKGIIDVNSQELLDLNVTQ